MLDTHNPHRAALRIPMPRRLLLVLGLFTTLSSPQALPAQALPYIGFGLRLGYVIGEGPSFSAEMTAGIFMLGFIGSIGVGGQTMPTAPNKFGYVCLSGGYLLGGFSVGPIFYSQDNNKYIGTRKSIWAGPMIVLVSWDSYQFPSLDAPKKMLIGLWGRVPVPLVDIKFYFDYGRIY